MKWKVLGLAGIAGVAATGVLVARNTRRRAQLTPEEVRSRLQQRYAEAAAAGDPMVPDAQTDPQDSEPWHHRWHLPARVRRR